MRNNFYNQGTNIIAHHYFNLEKKTNPIRYNTIGSSPQIVTYDLPRFSKPYSQEEQSGYRGEMAGTGNTRGQQEGTRSATDNQKYVIRSLGELTGPLRAGQSGQTLDLRDHNISPEVYMALARGEAVEVELQQMAPERVNLFTPMLASVMQIFGGMSGGVAYNEDLSHVITGRGGSDKGQLGKAAEFVNRHGSAYSFGLGTGEHIDVVAKFRVLNQEDARKPAKDIVEPPPYKAPSGRPENAKIQSLSDPDTSPESSGVENPKGTKAQTITPPNHQNKPGVGTTIPDVIDPDFFKLMKTSLGYFKDGLTIDQISEKSGIDVKKLIQDFKKAGIQIDPKTNKPTEITVANFLNNRYNTRQGSDIVTNDGRGKNPGAGYTDKNGNTQSSAIIPSLDLKGLAEGGYKFDLDLKGKAVSDYVLTAVHATPVFDNGVGSFDIPLHEGITKKDVTDAENIFSKYIDKTSKELLPSAKQLLTPEEQLLPPAEQLLIIAKGMEKSNPQEAANIYASLFLQVENNTRVENGHLGAGHVNKLRESVVTRTNVFVDGSRALNTLVNANGVGSPVNVANLSTALSGNQDEIDEQSKGLKSLIDLYNDTPENKIKIDPAKISPQDALKLLDFSTDKLNEIKKSLKEQGYIDADPEFRLIHTQIDGVLGQPDNKDSGIEALKGLINNGNGSSNVGSSNTNIQEYNDYNEIATRQSNNHNTPLSETDLGKLDVLSKSLDPKVANAAKTIIANNTKFVNDLKNYEQSQTNRSKREEYNMSIGSREYLDPFVKSLESKGINTDFLKDSKGRVDYKKTEDFVNALQGLGDGTQPQGSFKAQLEQVLSVDTDKSLLADAKNIHKKFKEFDLGNTKDQEAVQILNAYLSESDKQKLNGSNMYLGNNNVDVEEGESAAYVKINKTTLSVPAVQRMVEDSFRIGVQTGLITQKEVSDAKTPEDKAKLFDKLEDKLNDKYNPNLKGQKQTLTTDNLYGSFHITNLQRALNDHAQELVKGAQSVDKLYDGETMTEKDNKDLQVLVDKYNADPMNKDSQININDLKDNKALGSKLLDFAQKDLEKISDSIGPELSQYGQLAELKSDIIKSIGKPGSGSGIAAVKALLDKQANAPTPKPDKPGDTPNTPTSGNAKEYQEGLKNTLTQLKDCLASGVHEVNVDMDGDGKKEPVKISEYLKKLEKDYQMFLLQSSSGEKVDVQGMANLFSEVHYDAGMSLGGRTYNEVHQGFALALEAMGNVDVDNLFGSRGGKQTVDDSNGLTHAMINQVMLNAMRTKFNDCFDEKTGVTDKSKLNDILKLGFKNVNDAQALQVLAVTERLFKSADYHDKNGSDLTQRYQDLVASGKKPDEALNAIFSDVQANFAEANGFNTNGDMGILRTSENKIIISGDQANVANVSDLAGKHLNIETGTSSGSVQPPSSNVPSSTEDEETEAESGDTGTTGNVVQVGDNVTGNDNPVKPTEVAQTNPPSNPQGNDLLARLDYTPGSSSFA